MIKPRLSALIYGPSGYGKSWLGSTTPPPRLIIDLEGRAHYTPNGRGATEWDGTSDPMEMSPSPTRTYIVTVTSIAKLASIYSWLASGKHPFSSVTVDSLMFTQMRMKREIAAGGPLRTQDWGTLLTQLEDLVTNMHDLTLEPKTKVQCVVFLAGSVEKNGFQVPLMQGQIASKLPFLVDLSGYLDNTRDGEDKLVRQLFVEPYPLYGIKDVKDGTDVIKATLGGVIRDPNFETFCNILVAAGVDPLADGKKGEQ